MSPRDYDADRYAVGFHGSAGGHRPGATGTKTGKGRASSCRSYTVTVTHKQDGRRKRRTVGPGYYSKKDWTKMRLEAARHLIKAFEAGRVCRVCNDTGWTGRADGVGSFCDTCGD